MTINYLEMTETEEDFTGVARANLVVNEIHTFEDTNNRIFCPDLGQFYINANFSIIDNISGRSLVRGEDYEIEYYSKRVFAKSGLDNGYLIHVSNVAVSGVEVTYQAVGGLYTSPAYLISMMMERYPEGIGPVVFWKNVLFKPDQFRPAGHRHHSSEIYAMSPHVDALERVRGGLAEQDRLKFGDFYDNTLARYNELMALVNTGYNGMLSSFQETRKGLELQQGDFIYTDSTADQATLRKYGKWKRHTNTMLAAGSPTAAGTSMSVGSGVTNPVRQTNLYQRIDDPWGQGTDLEEMTLLLQPSKASFNEGETVTIDIVGVNIPPLTQVTGRFVGLTADNIEGGNLTWQVTLDAFGKAQIQLKTISNGRTTGNVNITVLPDQFATSAITLLMIDTSKTPVYNLFFSSDAQGLSRITRTNEGSVVYMNIIVTNPTPNQELTLNYSAGSAKQDDFVTTLPSTVTIPSNGIIRVRLETKSDERAEGEEVFVVSLLPLGSIDLGATIARTELTIVDTSYQAEFNAVFSTDTGGVNRITEINEGQTFYLFATTSLPNGTTVNFEYGGTTANDDFSERPTSAVVSGGVVVAAIGVRNDARTDGDKIMGLTIRRTSGIALANLSIVVRDTSQAPEATIFFTDRTGGTLPVAEFNEGQTIFITIDTKNVENGSYIDLSYQMDGAITQADINKEFTAPLPVRVPVTNNRAVIAATILEDYKTDQNRNFRCILDMSGVSASCIIRDTSVPIVNVKFSGNSTGTGNITDANEGQTIYLVVETKGYAAGTTLNLVYSGTANDDDFNAARPTSILVTSTGSSITPMTIKNDFQSEGIEKMIVTVRAGTTNVATTELNIQDTSLTPVLEVLLSMSATTQTAVTNINEGVTAYVHVNWTNLPLNTRIDWSVTHISTSADDFDKSGGSITNAVTTGTGNDTLTTKLDRLTENTETFRVGAKVTLPDGRVVSTESAIITLNDTSKSEDFTVAYSSDALGNSTITRINEGSAAYLVIRGTNIPDGTKFKLSLPSTGAGFANNADIDPAISDTEVSMTNNFVSYRINIIADRTTEGDETLLIRTTRVDTNVPRDASLIVVDTSTTLSVTSSLYLTNGTKPTSNNFKEGDTGYVLVSFTNGTVGDRIRPTLDTATGNAVAADFVSSEFGVEKAISSAVGTLRWNFEIKADRTTEGDKIFGVNVTNITSASTLPLDGVYRILDTSKTTTYTTSGWTTDASAGTLITSVDEGTTAYLQTTPVDGVIGDVYRLDITGGTATLNQDYQIANNGNVVYNTAGMVVRWTFNMLPDRITDGNKTIIGKITNTTTGQVVGSYQIIIVDTSKTPAANATFNNGSAASGGTLITSINEGSNMWLKLALSNQVIGDKWRISIDPTSGANAADIGNFVTTVLDVTASQNTVLEKQISVTADSLTEGPETLVMKLEFQANGTTTWVDGGKASILINDTSKAAVFDIYYSNNPEGTNRITSIGEGTTVYLIAKTENVATGTVLQVNFPGSTVDSNDFTTAAPYAFPTDLNTLVPMTVQANGIAFYRFDIKADLSVG